MLHSLVNSQRKVINNAELSHKKIANHKQTGSNPHAEWWQQEFETDSADCYTRTQTHLHTHIKKKCERARTGTVLSL